ncbi:MAG: alanine--tRNA ligase-related protein, partial [Planctomycetota bacterium]
FDLAERILAERDIDVDRGGFDAEMEAQRERARRGSKISESIFAAGPVTELKAQGVPVTTFLGYDERSDDGQGLESSATVAGLVVDGALVDEATEGNAVTVVLDRSPFYAEAGGQVGDRGRIESGGPGVALRIDVEDTRAQDGYVLHAGRVAAGRVAVGAAVRPTVDAEARDATRRNHTATHLLHLALKQILGEHVRQEGSMVAPDRLRFDFSHPRALTPDEIARIEARVNAWILANDPVQTREMPLAEAKASGAVSLFGEKYAETVRVVSVESGSRELCGGTHCRRTGDIGSFRITLETSIAAGIRRMEAVTGQGAVAAFERDREVVREVAGLLKAAPEELLERVRGLQDELKAIKKAGEKAKRDAGLQAAGRLAADAQEIGGLRVLAASVPGVDGKALRGVWDRLRMEGIDALGAVGEANGKAPLLVGLSAAAMDRGLDARTLLGEATALLKGGGGGRSDLAQGQGQDRSRIEDALEHVRAALRAALEG